MKLQDLKVGDKITHYCSGAIVEGTVIKTEVDCVETEHNEIVWGENIQTRSFIQKSTSLQYPISQTTTGAWFKGKKLKA